MSTVSSVRRNRASSKVLRILQWTFVLSSYSAHLLAAATFVQQNSSTPQSPTATMSIGYPAVETAGDLNVVVVGWNDTTAAVQAVWDSRGNVYTLAVGPTSGAALSQSIYYAANISGGANTVTVTFSQPAVFPDIRILEYQGVGSLDVTAGASGSSATTNSGEATIKLANELIFGANTVRTTTSAAGSGFTSRAITAPDGDIAEDKVVSSPGSNSVTATLSSPGPWVMQMATFFEASGQQPAITSVIPNNGSIAGGTRVTITGSNFAPGSAVAFGRNSAENVVVASSTTILATTPPGRTEGAVTVSVTANGQSGSLANGFIYNDLAEVTYVQGNFATPQSALSTVRVPFLSSQKAGDLNVLVVGWNDALAIVTGISDTAGNRYVLAVGPTLLPPVASQSIYYAKNIAAAGPGANVLTVTFSSAATFPDIRILEYSGADLSDPVDVTAANIGNSAISDSGPANTTNPTDLIFGANLVQTLTAGSGVGFTVRLLTTPDGDIAEDRMVNQTGSYSTTAPISSGQWIAQMVAFRGASSTNTPLVDLSSTSVSFGNEPTEIASPPQSITMTNIGTAQLRISSIAVSGGNFGDFSQRNNCGSSLELNASCTITINFIPTSIGARSSTIVITDNAAGGQQVIQLLGTGTQFAVTPGVSVLTSTRTQMFTADISNVTWSVDGVVNGTSTSGTITTGGLYTPPVATGIHTVTATTAKPVRSASATVYVTNYPGMFTYHNDNLRTGQNVNEIVLTPSNVSSAHFGKLLSYALDGIAFASPLYVADLPVPGIGFRNVVYVATEHDSVYAFDADGLSKTALWRVSFLRSGAIPVPCGDTEECGDIPTEIGVTGTPVIDRNSGTIYVVAATKEGSTYVQRLHALDLATGAEKFGGPVVLQARVSGTGSDSSGGMIIFDPLNENQRPALLLSNGIVYIGFASHGDQGSWHGWVLGYNATTLEQMMKYNVTPNGNGGGIWQGGGGLAADSNGNIYFVTGNGDFDANTGGTDYGDSVEKINPEGTVLDYFTPYDQGNMNANDLDLGSSGPVMLVDQPDGTHPHLLINSGKTGTIYVINRDNLGRYSSNNSQIVQSLPNVLPSGGLEAGNFSTPVFFNGYLYFGAVNDTLKAFRFTQGLLSPAPTSRSSAIYPVRGASLAISADGSANGILWSLQNNGVSGSNDVGAPGVLFAYDATNLSKELYNSSQAGSRDTMDIAAKFSVPLIANGKVFVGGQTQLTIYGLLP